MVDDFNDHNDAVGTFVDDSVEQAPKRGKVLDEEILNAVLTNEGSGEGGLSNQLPVETVAQEDRAESPSSARDALGDLFWARFESPEFLLR